MHFRQGGNAYSAKKEKQEKNHLKLPFLAKYIECLHAKRNGKNALITIKIAQPKIDASKSSERGQGRSEQRRNVHIKPVPWQ